MTEQQKSANGSKSRDHCPASFHRWLRWLWQGTAALILVLVLVVALYAAFRFIPEGPVRYDNMEDHFKYGSTGGDLATGIPYWIWQAMPLVCADTLQAVAGERLVPDYRQRTLTYHSGENAPVKRRAPST